MRQAKWLIVFLAAACLAGCSTDEAEPNRDLSEKIEEARRLYGRATALLADPGYLDAATDRTYAMAETVIDDKGTRYGGLVTRTETGLSIRDLQNNMVQTVAYGAVASITGYDPPKDMIRLPTSLPAPSDEIAPLMPNTEPTSRQEALALLATARETLETALTKAPGASVALLGHAKLLLGEIGVARGGYHTVQAARLRVEADEHRGLTQDLLTAAQNHGLLASFNKGLASMSRTDIVALSSSIAAEAKKVNTDISAGDGKIAEIARDVEKLSKANASLRDKAKGVRNQYGVTTGPKSLELLARAQEIEKVIAANDARIAAGTDRSANVKSDVDMLTHDKRWLKIKSQAIADRLVTMDQRSTEAITDMKAAEKDSATSMMLANAAAGKVGRISKAMLVQEGKAVGSFTVAAEFLDGALTHIKDIRARAGTTEVKHQAADEILEALGDDIHLASAIALRASTDVSIAAIRQNQIDTRGLNALLAGRITDVAGQVSAKAEPLGEEMTDYVQLTNARDDAIARLTQAETDLDELLSGKLKRGIGKKTRWNYEAMLANAYFAHYQLTDDADVLSKAEKSLGEALAGKEGSPYLATVLRLKDAIEKARP